ncbi:type 1 fimbrial major subunit FimA [Enterobacter hormaechei]
MKKNKILMAMGGAMLLAAGCANAADASTSVVTVTGGTVHFKGSLIDAACSVSTDSADQIVDLGQHPLHDFKTVGDKTELRPFTIKLEDCDTTVASTASVAFSGAVDSANADLLAVDATAGNGAGATGVGIQILDESSNTVKPDGSTFSTAHKLIDGENVLNFKSQYVSTVASPTAGQANADATFIMQYQ